MKNLQSMIKKWHVETFPNATNKAILNKLQEEMLELDNEISSDANITDELPDVCIVILAYCARNDIDLEELVNKKMYINKARTWGKENSEGDRPRVR